METREKMSTAPLPNFDNPPVNEVVLGMQFAAPHLAVVHVGGLYQRLRHRFPQIEQVYPLPPSFETFAPAPAAAPMLMQLQVLPMFSRQWFISDDDEQVVQFQSDRLLVNWRKRLGGGPYPRYSKVRELFEEAWRAFQDLLEKDIHGPFSPNQCEVNYINVIPLDHEKGLGKPGLWTSLWNDEEDGGEGVQFVTKQLLQDEKGAPFARLMTQLDSAWVEGRPALQISLAVRGRPLTNDGQGVLNFFDTGRAAIVTRFKDITTRAAHREWGLRQ